MDSKVKWFDDEKVFGFVEYKDNENIFVHYLIKADDDRNGKIVEFDAIKTEDGYKIENVVYI